MKKIILYLVLILFISCATSSPVLYQPLSDAKYPKTTKVDVFEKGEKPDQEYTEIGNLEIKMAAHKQKAMYAAVVAKAKEIGADGVMLIKDEMKIELVATPRSIDNRQGTDAMEKEIRQLVFLAIKYVDKE
jgi:hypothetical protein